MRHPLRTNDSNDWGRRTSTQVSQISLHSNCPVTFCGSGDSMRSLLFYGLSFHFERLTGQLINYVSICIPVLKTKFKGLRSACIAPFGPFIPPRAPHALKALVIWNVYYLGSFWHRNWTNKGNYVKEFPNTNNVLLAEKEYQMPRGFLLWGVLELARQSLSSPLHKMWLSLVNSFSSFAWSIPTFS